ncbi:hypothetical protein MRB53_004439 [Persea americana]|uniref:Uncharacterized protein n=1 Tax=Persea americana TaxID=3435 RepID=A0ACC2MAP5_PERAE|nr:hypothetical protein MRB53_004439 [Persea americana]
MGRAPCCSGEHAGLKKGPWTLEEDQLLRTFLLNNPNTSWRQVPPQAGLLRCGKSCRLRWMNYLRPDIRRGNFTLEEENLIIQLHAAVGNKWSVIASQLPGRTDNEIKNLWNTKLGKLLVLKGINPRTHQPLCNPILSDYVRQWVKSIENSIITGLMARSSSNNINSNSLHPTLPSFMTSLPLDSSLNEEGQPLKASPHQNALRDSSWVDDGSSQLNDNLDGDLTMGEEACLRDNMDQYLRDEFGNAPSSPFFDGYMDSMMSTADLEEGLLATKA